MRALIRMVALFGIGGELIGRRVLNRIITVMLMLFSSELASRYRQDVSYIF